MMNPRRALTGGFLRWSAFVMLALPQLDAVPLRVATFNIGANRDSNGNITESLNDSGTTDFETVRSILARINADVVCLQELANADVSGGLNGDTNSDVHALAALLGLPHVLIPTSSGVFDFTLRNAILSRYPFEDIDEIGTTDYQDSIGAVGADGKRARDVTRAMPAVVIEVPGAAAPTTIITLHNKSATGLSDRFRRAVELARLEDYLDRNGLNATDNLIITGDFNLSGNSTTFSSEPTNGMPGTWNRGIDIPLPITYSNDVDFYFPAPYQLVALDARNVAGGAATFQFGGATLDFILPSPALTVVGSEIYRSDLDTSNTQGLAKVGQPLPANTSALASDHWAVFADFELADLIPPPTSYSLTSADPEVIEDFSNFAGTAAPARWRAEAVTWRGLYPGQADSGAYAFEDNGNRSLGVVACPSCTFSATFENNTAQPIQALELSYLVRQFTSETAGVSDTLTARLLFPDGSALPVPGLSFATSPSAQVPSAQTLSAPVSGFTVAPGSSFDLEITAAQGMPSGGPVSSQVFINEFHYDNTGSDEGEFVEVVVAPGFEANGGDLATVQLVFYNGATGQQKPYRTIALPAFGNYASPTVVDGYRLFTVFQPDIQNGAPDGLALVINGVVEQFLSYEGSFTALEGPATGRTSQDIGVEQTPTYAAGLGSLGLTGSGPDSDEMNWIRFGQTVAHTPSQPNPGQTFTGSPPPPPQAFSFDEVTVRILSASTLDSDGDGLPDDLEIALGLNPFLADSSGNGISDFDEDSDGDGQSNGTEFLITLTDPTGRNSFFQVTLVPHPTNATLRNLTFPTLLGRNYQILGGSDPSQLLPLATYEGTDQPFQFTISTQTPPTYFLAVRVTLAP